MNKIFKFVNKVIFCTFLVSCIFFVNQVSAAENNSEAMQAFIETMKNSSNNNKVFHEDIFFVVPTMQSELDFIIKANDTNFQAAGDLNFWITSENGNSSNMTIPFYMTQAAKDMQIYFELDKKWYKFQSPSLAAVTADMVTTPNEAETEKIISEVKDVTILQESDTHRTMLVRLDGNKIADEMKIEAEKNPADKGTADDAELQNKFLQYLDSGFRNSEMWYTWTVDKQDWHTVAMSFHLSGLVQATATAILQGEGENLSGYARNLLETIAFYSETKAYTTYLNDDAAKKLEIPKKALKAKVVDSLTPAQK